MAHFKSQLDAGLFHQHAQWRPGQQIKVLSPARSRPFKTDTLGSTSATSTERYRTGSAPAHVGHWNQPQSHRAQYWDDSRIYKKTSSSRWDFAPTQLSVEGSAVGKGFQKQLPRSPYTPSTLRNAEDGRTCSLLALQPF